MTAIRQRTLHVGLTGGIGSGKSTVGQMLASFGATLIDADQISREATSPGGAAMPEIAQTFGPQYITADGALDRDRMRALAFSRPDARKQLEAIVHPLVGKETQARAHAATAAGQRLIVFDVPLLVESGHWPRKLDTVVVVDCPTETQITRVTLRSALAREAIEGIMASQASRNARRAAADVVVYNDNLSLDALQAQVHALARWFGL